VEQRLGRGTVVGEQHKSFGLVVKATDRKDARETAREKIHHGGTTPRIAPGGQHAARLVHEPVTRLRRPEEPPVEPDRVRVGIRGVSELDGCAVHGHPTAREELLATPTRGHTGGRENLLQAHPHLRT
jgi:hypothetical protein